MIYSLTAPLLNSPGCIYTSVSPWCAVRPRMTVARIKEVVAKFYRIPLGEMVSARRGREVARPRQVAMFFSKELTPKSLPDIGRLFGNRDHTTVIHAIKAVERRMGADADFAVDMDVLRTRLAG